MPNDNETALKFIRNIDNSRGEGWSDCSQNLADVLCNYAGEKIEEAQKDLLKKIKQIISQEIDWCVNQNNAPENVNRESFVKGLKQAQTLVSGCLLPEIEICPFCGISKGRLHFNFDYVECPTCGARGQMFDGHPLDAVQVWNSLSKLAEDKDEPDA
jgi:rubrerythrin